MKTFGLIRHGTTEWNLAGRMQGQMDMPLAEVGRQQTGLLAKRLKKEAWDGIVSSDLIRAEETATMISDITGIPLLGLDPRLRERAFGQLEGTTLQDRVTRWGEQWREMDLGMENNESLLARWSSFLTDAKRDYNGKSILLVSHGGYIASVLESFLGRKIEERLNNTSLTVIEWLPSGWNCQLLNCTTHLAELEQEA